MEGAVICGSKKVFASLLLTIFPHLLDILPVETHIFSPLKSSTASQESTKSTILRGYPFFITFEMMGNCVPGPFLKLTCPSFVHLKVSFCSAFKVFPAKVKKMLAKIIKCVLILNIFFKKSFMSNVESILKETQERFAKTIENFKNSIAGLSTKASPAIFNAIRVEAYGSETPISQVASINVSDSKTLMVRVHDAGLAGNVSKAIQSANLGVSVAVEGSSIRVTMPPMSEERRKSTAGLVTKALEDAKVAVRNIRRDQNDLLKKGLKDKIFAEDVVKKSEEKIQKFTDECTKTLEGLAKTKVDEIMSF